MSQYSFDEQSWRRSVESSERRRQLARERRRQQQKTLLGVAVALIVLLVLASFVLGQRRQAGTPPQFVVSWSQFQQPLELAGTTPHHLAIRPGRPVTVTMMHSEKWSVQWSGTGVQAENDRAMWDAVTDAPELTATIRPRVSGAARLTAWMRTPFRVTFYGHAPQQRADGLFSFASGAATDEKKAPVIWLSPQVGASVRSAAWDERALSLLEKAATAQPLEQAGDGQTNPVPRWEIVPSFEGAQGKRAKDDTATYAIVGKADALDGNFPGNFLKLAQFLSTEAPQASIKVIVKDPGTARAAGIVRLAFDDSGQRAGWVKRADEESGQPFVWWE